MATFNTSTLTEKGAELTATALATAQSIEFTGLKIGDGEAPAEPEKLLELINPLMPASISKVFTLATEKGITHLRASFQNKTGAAFHFRELGIYARIKDTGTPILYAYANAGDTADLIDTVEEGSLLQQTLIIPIATGSADVLYVDNPSALLTRQDLLEYLPLAGGTMTGYITLDPDGGTKYSYNIGYDFDKGDGGGVAFRGSKRDGDPGSFVLYAKNGSAANSLTGKPTGILEWDGSDIVLKYTDVTRIRKETTENGLYLLSGYGTENGAGVFLYGEKHNTSSGIFLLRAAANGEKIDLLGRPDGTLLWGGRAVLTSIGGKLDGTIASSFSGNPVLRNINSGGALYLFPLGDPTYKGGFILRAYSELEKYVDLQGWSDGRLQWKNQDIVTLIKSWNSYSGEWYRYYGDGFLEQGGIINSYTPTLERQISENLLQPFRNEFYTLVITIWDEAKRKTTYSVMDKTSSGFRVNLISTVNTETPLTVEWYACGFA